jgi:hypothetical protein
MTQQLKELNLTESQSKELDEYLYKIVENAFRRDDYEYKRFCLNAALKKKTLRSAFNDGELENTWLTQSKADEISKELQYSEDYYEDEFSRLYTPILLEISRAVNRLVGNICFPLNGASVGINRTYSKFCEDNGIDEFLSTLNKCQQKIIERENANFKFKEIYKAVLQEGLQHSFWALGHEYDNINHVVDVFAPGVETVGVYPQYADWRKTNRVFVSDRNYSELFARSDLNREIIESIKPQDIDNDTTIKSLRKKSKALVNSSHTMPFGQVRLFNIFCPSVYLPSKEDGTPVIIKGLFVLGVINPLFRENLEKNEEFRDKKVLILKSKFDVEREHHGLLLGTPITSNPNEFYNDGLFYPWLDHQVSANSFNAANTRLASYMSQGPVNVENTGRAVALESTTLEAEQGWKPYQRLDGKKVTPVFGAEFANVINVGNSTIQTLSNQIRAGIGVGANISASLNTGRNVKDEVASVFRTGDLTIADYALAFIDAIQVPSIYTRIKMQAEILLEQVSTALSQVRKMVELESLEQGTEGLILDDNSILESVLEQNPLFQRLVNYSGIRKEYKVFAKKRQREIIENEKIMLDILNQEEEVKQKILFINSPIQPLPPLPPNQIRNELGEVIDQPIPMELEAQRQQEYFQMEMQRRKQAETEVKYQIKDIELKTLMIKDDLIPVQPISNVLLLQLLTEPIAESDIEINGAKEALLKTIKDEDLERFVGLLQILAPLNPELLKRYDPSKLMSFATRGNPDFIASQVEKDPENILREEEAERQRFKVGQELQMMMAQNPGSQTPENPMSR